MGAGVRGGQVVGAVHPPHQLALDEVPVQGVRPDVVVGQRVGVLDTGVQVEVHLLGATLGVMLDDPDLLHALDPRGIVLEIEDHRHHLVGRGVDLDARGGLFGHGEEAIRWGSGSRGRPPGQAPAGVRPTDRP